MLLNADSKSIEMGNLMWHLASWHCKIRSRKRENWGERVAFLPEVRCGIRLWAVLNDFYWINGNFHGSRLENLFLEIVFLHRCCPTFLVSALQSWPDLENQRQSSFQSSSKYITRKISLPIT